MELTSARCEADKALWTDPFLEVHDKTFSPAAGMSASWRLLLAACLAVPGAARRLGEQTEHGAISSGPCPSLVSFAGALGGSSSSAVDQVEAECERQTLPVILPCRALAQLVVAAPRGGGSSSAAELCARALKGSEDAPPLNGQTFLVVFLFMVLFVVGAAGLWYFCLPIEEKGPVRRPNSSRITYAGTGPGTLIINIVQAKGISVQGGMTVQVRAGDIYGGKETRVVHGESPLWNEEKHLPILDFSEIPKCTFVLREAQRQQTVGVGSLDISNLPMDMVVDKEIPIIRDGGQQIGTLQFSICFETIHGGRRIPSSSALVTETRHSALSPAASIRTIPGGVGATFGSARSIRTQPQVRETRREAQEIRRGGTDRSLHEQNSFPEPP